MIEESAVDRYMALVDDGRFVTGMRCGTAEPLGPGVTHDGEKEVVFVQLRYTMDMSADVDQHPIDTFLFGKAQIVAMCEAILSKTRDEDPIL